MIQLAPDPRHHHKRTLAVLLASPIYKVRIQFALLQVRKLRHPEAKKPLDRFALPGTGAARLLLPSGSTP